LAPTSIRRRQKECQDAKGCWEKVFEKALREGSLRRRSLGEDRWEKIAGRRSQKFRTATASYLLLSVLIRLVRVHPWQGFFLIRAHPRQSAVKFCFFLNPTRSASSVFIRGKVFPAIYLYSRYFPRISRNFCNSSCQPWAMLRGSSPRITASNASRLARSFSKSSIFHCSG
jgi:hypothetical protein